VVSNLTVKVGADIDGLQKELKKATAHLGAFGKGMDGISSQLKTMVAGMGVMEIGRQVIQTTSEFQKFAAVLKNTLGSESAAQRSLEQIKDFAAATPFSVQELTASFVKLANQGFMPTTDELRKLGDLAASTGKNFDMLTEAIIDAQVGEFERLKEFGIRAQKEGDKVTFTFKGVKKQVDFTADSIREYILSLGGATGVSGSMAAISETLGGRISNLADAWDGLMVAMGESSSGPLFGAVSALTNITKALTDFRSEMAVIGTELSPFHDLRDLSKETLDYILKAKNISPIVTPFSQQSDADFLRDYNKNLEKFTSILKDNGVGIADINTLWLHYVENRTAASEADAEGASAKRRADFQAYIDKLHEQAAAAKRAAAELAAFIELKNGMAAGAGALRTEVTKKTGSDFLFDTGVLANFANLQAKIKEGLRAMGGELKINSQEWNLWAAGLQARTQQTAEAIQMDFAPIIQSAISDIGHALGNAISGSASFGDSLLSIFGGVLIKLGGILIATGLGIAAFKKSLLTLNPIVAAAAGAALIALGVVMKGRMKALGSSAGSSHRSAAGSAGGSNIGNLGNGGLEIRLGGEVRIQGRDLVYIFNREEQLNTRTNTRTRSTSSSSSVQLDGVRPRTSRTGIRG
jgi:hypothetical protein